MPDSTGDAVALIAEVHQATGMIGADLGVGMDEAFALLQARSYSEGRLTVERRVR